MARRWKKGDKITPDVLQESMDILAKVVALPDGEKYVPLFLRLEREAAELERRQDALTRIRARATAAAESHA